MKKEAEEKNSRNENRLSRCLCFKLHYIYIMKTNIRKASHFLLPELLMTQNKAFLNGFCNGNTSLKYMYLYIIERM